jgi:hypothetical protein
MDGWVLGGGKGKCGLAIGLGRLLGHLLVATLQGLEGKVPGAGLVDNCLSSCDLANLWRRALSLGTYMGRLYLISDGVYLAEKTNNALTTCKQH